MEVSRYLVKNYPSRHSCLLALLLFVSSPLVATVNEPMRWEWLTGYRTDHFHWYLKKEGNTVSSEKISHLQSWENALQFRAIHRDLFVLARGAYAFGKAKLSASEILGSFGYAVNLTPDRTYKVVLIPFIGYGADFEWFSGMHMSWFGPYIGGFFLVEPGEQLQFEAGYAYHRDHLRFNFQKIKIKDGRNLEHSGWIRMDYLVNSTFRIGLYAQVEYFCSRVLEAAHGLGKFKMRWTPLSGGVVIAQKF